MQTNKRENDWPPIKPGTAVKTTSANPNVTGWTAEAATSRIWGVEGNVIAHHDSHGLCYDVKHPNGSVGTYDPTELEVVRAA